MLKRLAPLLLCLTLAGCVKQISHIPAVKYTSALDLTRYAERGFLITTGPYGGEYEAVGIVSVLLYPEARREIKTNREGWDEPGGWSIEEVSYQEAVDSLYHAASRLGANGIMSLNFEAPLRFTSALSDMPVLSGVLAQGLAIRRR